MRCLEIVGQRWRRPDSWHCADVNEPEIKHQAESCPRLARTSRPAQVTQKNHSTTPHSLSAPFSLINYYINSQYHFRRFPSTLLNTVQPGGFPPKKPKNASEAEGQVVKCKCFSVVAAGIPSRPSHCPWVQGSWMLLTTLACGRCHPARAQPTGEKKRRY